MTTPGAKTIIEINCDREARAAARRLCVRCGFMIELWEKNDSFGGLTRRRHQ